MAKNALAGWKKAVVYNPANGDRVQLNRLSAQASELPGDPNIKTESAAGQVWGGEQWPITVGFMDSDGLALLESWQVGYTPCRMVVLAPAGMSILFQESEEIDFIQGTGVNAREGLKIHRVMIEAVGSGLSIQQVKNLARAITFSGDQGTLVFPMQGPTLTLAADYTTPAGATLVIEAKDYAGTQVAISSQSATAGRVSTTITLPADTYTLEIDLLNGGTGTVQNISLRADGSSEFISY